MIFISDQNYVKAENFSKANSVGTFKCDIGNFKNKNLQSDQKNMNTE